MGGDLSAPKAVDAAQGDAKKAADVPIPMQNSRRVISVLLRCQPRYAW